MPWNDQSGPQGGGQGPWGSGPRRPWGQQQPPRRPPPGQGPDLEDYLSRLREQLFGNGAGGRPGGPGGMGRGVSWPLLAGVLVLGWLLSGVYLVDEGERGVISRFGAYAGTTTPGLHWHLPWPVEARRVINVTRQRSAEIGSRDSADDIPDESLMITGDRNIVQVHFRINFTISDVVKYAFNVRDPDIAVSQIAESAMREVIGKRQLDLIMTTERNAVQRDVQTLMQHTLDEYQAGVQIVEVQIRHAVAPQAVSAAFNDVLDARQDAETAANNANRDVSRILNEARAYRERVVREATGEADRFNAVHGQYRLAPQVTRDRLYMETMERVYQRGNLVILDQRSGAVPYLPLESLTRRQTPAPAQPAQPGQGARQ